MDNVVCVNEIIHSVKQSKQEGIILKIDMEKAYDRVNWQFLFELLHSRGFHERWIQWIRKLLIGGHISIKINDKLTQYFEIKRGLKQGDPLSPLLFNIVADCLNQMIRKSKINNMIRGLGPPIDDDLPLTNLHYADDTIIFCQADSNMIQRIKWIFIGFEALSGMRINYHKSELYALNVSEDKTEQLAQIFGCKIAQLPITYLGVPIHWKKIGTNQWQDVIDKFEKKLQGWQGSLLSYGGKITLIKSVLSSLPIYMMSFHYIPSSIIKRIDQIRARFLWNSGQSNKYHLVNWKTIKRSKDNGGIGLKDFRLMNIALLCKWLWKLKNTAIQGWWKDMIIYKYGVFGTDKKQSYFWKKIMEYAHIIHIHSHFTIGNGKTVHFWLDKWCQDRPLKLMFPSLFKICTEPEITVQRALSENMRYIKFNRNLNAYQYQEMGQIHNLVVGFIPLSPASDKVRWSLTADGKYSTQSMYNWLEFGGIDIGHQKTIWDLKIPLKIKMFLWLLSKRRLLTRDNLILRGWDGNPRCSYCSHLETIDHLLFLCTQNCEIWNWFFRQKLFADRPVRLEDLSELGNKIQYKYAYYHCCAAILWILWKHRNETTFSGTKPHTLRYTVHAITRLLHHWSGLWSASLKDQVWKTLPDVEEMLDQLSGPEVELEETVPEGLMLIEVA